MNKEITEQTDCTRNNNHGTNKTSMHSTDTGYSLGHDVLVRLLTIMYGEITGFLRQLVHTTDGNLRLHLIIS